MCACGYVEDIKMFFCVVMMALESNCTGTLSIMSLSQTDCIANETNFKVLT